MGTAVRESRPIARSADDYAVEHIDDSADAREAVQRFSQQRAIELPNDDLTMALADTEALEQRRDQSRANLTYMWQDLFRPDVVVPKCVTLCDSA